MKSLILLSVFVLLSCTSIRYEYNTNDQGHLEMTAIKSYLCYYDDEEKVKIIISESDGGRIEKILWDGRELTKSPILEKFPNEQQSFKSLRTMLTDDGEGLIIITATNKGVYQLRRSYDAKYDERTDEHIIKVNYNVKNYSSTEKLRQQWTQSIFLTDEAIATQKPESSIDILYPDSQVKLKIQMKKAYSPHIRVEGQILNMETRKGLLGTKERLNWSVVYTLKQGK